VILEDIAIQHIYKQRNSATSSAYTLHPFQVENGASAGRFEILRDINTPGQKKEKLSAHVTIAELAELYARDLLEEYGVRLRLQPKNRDYPTSPPGKKVPRGCIVTGSDFAEMVNAVDTRAAISLGLKQALMKFKVCL
jgi:hypothetical protein